MRDDYWMHREKEKEANIKENTIELYNLVSKFLRDCEDSKEVVLRFLQMARSSNLFLGQLPPEPTVDSIHAGLVESMPAWVQGGFADRVLAEGVIKYLRGETI